MSERMTLDKALTEQADIERLRERFLRLYREQRQSPTREREGELKRLQAELTKRSGELKQDAAYEMIDRLFPDLHQQYTDQRNLLISAGLLYQNEDYGSVCYGDRGIDGYICPVPELDAIEARMMKKLDLLRKKADQGFTKLLLVPFPTPMRAFIEDFSRALAGCGSFSVAEAPEDTNVANWDALLYYSRSTGRLKGKVGILDDAGDDDFYGWKVVLMQTDEQLGPSGKPILRDFSQGHLAGTRGSRFPRAEYMSDEIRAQDVAQSMNATYNDSNSPYHGESGLTPEIWMSACLYQATVGLPLDLGGTYVSMPLLGCGIPLAPPGVRVREGSDGTWRISWHHFIPSTLNNRPVRTCVEL